MYIDHVLAKTNPQVKYEISVINSSQENEQKIFLICFSRKYVYFVLQVSLVTLTFDLMNPKAKGVMS